MLGGSGGYTGCEWEQCAGLGVLRVALVSNTVVDRSARIQSVRICRFSRRAEDGVYICDGRGGRQGLTRQDEDRAIHSKHKISISTYAKGNYLIPNSLL